MYRKNTRKRNKSRRAIRFRKTRSKRGGMAKSKKEMDACPICLDPITKNDNVPKLKCKHYFHKACLEHVCRQSNNSGTRCPMCRRDISFECLADVTRTTPWIYHPHTDPSPYSLTEIRNMNMNERSQMSLDIQRHRNNYLARRRRIIARETPEERDERINIEERFEREEREARDRYFNINSSNSREPSSPRSPPGSPPRSPPRSPPGSPPRSPPGSPPRSPLFNQPGSPDYTPPGSPRSIHTNEIDREPPMIQSFSDIEEEEDMLTMGNVGDLIDYIPGNQLGFRHYKISLDENGDKYLEVIGDIEGYYDDVNYGLLGGKKNKKSKKRSNITRKKRA